MSQIADMLITISSWLTPDLIVFVVCVWAIAYGTYFKPPGE